MEKSKIQLNKKNHSYTIDVIRAFSAIFIVLFHYTYRYNQNQYIQAIHAEANWNFVVSWGYGAICTFFMLSGYLLAKNFENNQINPKKFLLKRLGRLYPTFWVCMTITSIVLITLFPEIKLTITEYIVNLTMLPSLFKQRYVDGAYWTMSYEIMFAIIFMGILWIRNIRIRKTILLILMSLSFIEWYCGHSDNVVFKFLRVFFIVNQIQVFCIGISIYYIKKFPKKVYYYILFALCCMIQMMQSESYVVNIFFVSTVVLLFLASYIDNIIRDNFIYRLIEFVALVSYPLYLLHQMIGFAVIKSFQQIGLKEEGWIIIPIIISFILAYIVHRYIEKPTAKQDFSKWPKLFNKQ